MRHSAQRRRIGLMLDLEWPYERHLSVFAGTQRYAAEAGDWECVVDEAAPETLRKSGRIYDGIIARATSELAAEARRRRVPVINTWFDSPAPSLPCVAPDFAKVGEFAAEHLLGLGLRRFLYVAVKGVVAGAMQLEAFRATIEAIDGELSCLWAPRTYNHRREARRDFHRSLASVVSSFEPPLGIFVSIPDMTARYIAHETIKRGLRIPQDICLIAGLNEPMLCLHPAPSLTSIDVSYEEVGYRAAQQLDAWMRGDRPAPTTWVAPRQVAARQSTDFIAVDDPIVHAALDYLATHFQQGLSVAEVADAIHASRRTLERRFQSKLGRSVGEEIRRLRIERAKRYLVDSELPVKSVARLAGFGSRQRMYEAFQAAGQGLPTRYRAGN